MANYCPECGAALVGAGKFCAECGVAVSSAAHTDPATTTRRTFDRISIYDLLQTNERDWMYDTGNDTTFRWQPGVDPAAVPPDVIRSLVNGFWPGGAPRSGQDIDGASGDFAVTIAECPSTPRGILTQLARFLCDPPDGPFDFDDGGIGYQALKVLEAIEDNPQCAPAIRAKIRRTIPEEFSSSASMEMRQPAVPEAASDPGTSPEVLNAFAGDKATAIRQAVAGNPGTPPQTLAGLASDDATDVRWWVAVNEATPVSTLLTLVADADNYVRESAARNPTLANHLDVLSVSDDVPTRRGVAANPASSVQILTSLVEDSVVGIDVLRNPNCPSALLVTNMDMSRYDPTEVVVRNPNFPIDLLPALAYGPQSLSSSTVVALLGNRSTRPDWLAASIQTWIGDVGVNEYEVPFGLAAIIYPAIDIRFNTGVDSMATDPADLVALADCEAAGVRCFIAAHPLTPTRTLETLCRDSHPVVRWLASENLINSPTGRELPDVPEPAPTGGDWSTYRDYLVEFAASPEPVLRLFVAATTEVPEGWPTPWPDGVINALAEDEDRDVRSCVAANPLSPKHLLATLAQDTDASVRARAAGNSSIAADVLPSLAQDASSEVRARVVSNSSTYGKLLRWMAANDADVEIRRLASEALGE